MSILDNLLPWQREFKTTVVDPFEGRVATMYLDTVGLVTVGQGCQIGNVEAQRLPFSIHGAPASAGDILREYVRVQRLGAGHLSAWYATPDSPRLSDDGIDVLLVSRIQSFTETLTEMFPALATWPDPAKIATLEMPWGLGDYKFRTTYPMLRAALARKDFRAAADECAWADPMGWYRARNAQRKQLYLAAASLCETNA